MFHIQQYKNHNPVDHNIDILQQGIELELLVTWLDLTIVIHFNFLFFFLLKVNPTIENDWMLVSINLLGLRCDRI